MKLKTLIIDDEEGSRNNLQFLLQNYCPQVEIAGLAADVDTGLQLIIDQAPDIVFLDIEMPEQDGFQLVERIPDNRHPKIVFTTAYPQYALQAFKVTAVDYLLKPIDIDELRNTVNRIQKILENTGTAVEKRTGKLIIPHQNGLTFLEEDEIICLEANRNYTKIYLHQEKTLLVAKTLGDFETFLEGSKRFFRTHRSYIVNLRHLIQFVNKDGGYLLLHNELKIPLSRNRKDLFMERIQQI